MRSRVLIASILVLAGATGVAFAGTCKCTSATLDFTPAFSVFRPGTLDTESAWSVTCNGNATYNVSISTGYSGNFGMRTMLQGGTGDALNYNIYTDTARSNVWSGTSVRTYDTSSGRTTFAEPLYLRFPEPVAGTQDVSYSGPAYWDVVTVTMDPVGGGPTNSCTLTVRTTVEAECRAPSATLSFATAYNAVTNATTPLDDVTALRYTCTKGVPATIQLDNGSHFVGTMRQMTGPGGDYLNYLLYSNPIRTIEWNLSSTVNVTSTSKDVPLGGAGGLIVYGRIAAGQDVTPGTYNDSVTATVNY